MVDTAKFLDCYIRQNRAATELDKESVKTNMVLGIILWTAIASVATGLMYVWDKRVAATGGRRIPERTLLLASALGGWPGAILVGRKIRHKTRKLTYQLWLSISVLANFAAIVGLLYWYRR